MEDKLDKLDTLGQTRSEVIKSAEIGLIKRGAFTYITNKQGIIISDGFHDFKLFTHGDKESQIRGVMGIRGSIKHALWPEVTEEGLRIMSSVEGFHDLEFRPDLGDRFVIKEGASHYYMIGKSGRKLHSKGYREIFQRGGKYYGVKGAAIVEEIDLPKEDREDKEGPRLIADNKTRKLLISKS